MKKQLRLWLYLPSVFIITAAGVALRTVATLKNFNFNTGYYADKTLITAASLMMLAAIIIALTYPIFHRDIRLIASFEGSRTFIPSGIVSVALLFLAFDFSRRLVTNNLPKSSVIAGDIPALKIIVALCVLFSVLSILGFFLTALSTKREDKSRAWFALSTVVFLLLYSIYIYFNANSPINSPAKLTDMCAYLLCALFFLFETRISLGRSIWPMYISFGMTAFAAAAYSAIPSLIVYFACGELISDSIYEIILTLALCVFIAARITGCASLREDSDAPIVSFIKENERIRLDAKADKEADGNLRD